MSRAKISVCNNVGQFLPTFSGYPLNRNSDPGNVIRVVFALQNKASWPRSQRDMKNRNSNTRTKKNMLAITLHYRHICYFVASIHDRLVGNVACIILSKCRWTTKFWRKRGIELHLPLLSDIPPVDQCSSTLFVKKSCGELKFAFGKYGHDKRVHSLCGKHVRMEFRAKVQNSLHPTKTRCRAPRLLLLYMFRSIDVYILIFWFATIRLRLVATYTLHAG